MGTLHRLSAIPSVVLHYKAQPEQLIKGRPTLVFLHSFMTDLSLFDKQFQDPAFAQLNLLAVDDHGHGKTMGREEFTFWDTAEDVLHILDDLHLDRVFVMGTSQGRFIALRKAVLRPEKIAGLSLLGTTALAETPSSSSYIKGLAASWPSKESIQGFAEAGFHMRFSSIETPDVQDWVATWTTRYAKTKKGYAMFQKTVRQLLERDGLTDKELLSIKAPALVLHGDDDKFYPMHDARAMAKGLKNSQQAVERFEELSAGGHYLSYTNATLVDARTADFISTVTGY